MKAYYISSEKPVFLSDLHAIGVKHWKLDPKTCQTDGSLDKLRNEEKYTYTDLITISPQHIPNYEEKMTIFFKEHLHLDDEIRLFLEGSGFFDVRDQSDQWIRIHCFPGDLLVLPEGIYHRFTLDDQKYAKVMRLFKGEPVWTPYNRDISSTDLTSKRKDYLKTLKSLNHLNAFVLETNQPVSKDYLASIGVLHWKISTQDEEKLNFIRKERGYSYSDVCTIDPDHLPNYEEKIKNFFNEHIHTDEEIRYFLEGSGYFDVRGHGDEWIRIHCAAKDLIILPAGIYHRFSPDDKNYAKVTRLFVGEPVWTPHNRNNSTDSMPIRQNYCSGVQSQKVQYGRENKTIPRPENFDPILQKIDAVHNHNECPILVYFTAANDPATGQPWCPDARKAQPLLEQVLGEIEKSFMFITAPIVRSEYKDNPDYLYRTHPGIQLKKVPTLVIWKNGAAQHALIETELHDIDRIRSFLKFDQYLSSL